MLLHVSFEITIPDSLSYFFFTYKVSFLSASDRVVYNFEIDLHGIEVRAFLKIWKKSDSTLVRFINLHLCSIYERSCKYL